MITIRAYLVNCASHETAGIFKFTIGINVNEAAGQTVPHVHIHLIPRYAGDVPNPLGGVRGVIPHKKEY